MLLSTSTNLVSFVGATGRNPLPFCIEMCAKGGYKVLDINFCEAMNPQSRLRDDDWESYIEEIAELGRRFDVRYTQSHLPYYDVFATKDEAKIQLLEKLIERSIIASGMLGVKWAVTHPCTVYTACSDMSVSKERNLEYYSKHVQTARENGLGIALENDFEYRSSMPGQRIFCASPYELVDLVDAFHDDKHVGICYDFGHANLTGGFHRHNLNVIGKRLRAVHVQDNRGQADEHMIPFYGTTNWEDAMAGLADIGYEGELTYEIQQQGRYFPNELKPLIVQQSIEVGNVLIGMYEKALKKQA